MHILVNFSTSPPGSRWRSTPQNLPIISSWLHKHRYCGAPCWEPPDLAEQGILRCGRQHHPVRIDSRFFLQASLLQTKHSQARKSISQTLIFQLFNYFLCHSKTWLIFMRTAALVPKHFSFNGTHSFSLSLKAKLSGLHSWWVCWVEYLMKIVTKIEGVVSFHTRTLTISITAQIIYNITGEIQMACYEWETFQWLHSSKADISYLLVDDQLFILIWTLTVFFHFLPHILCARAAQLIKF